MTVDSPTMYDTELVSANVADEAAEELPTVGSTIDSGNKPLDDAVRTTDDSDKTSPEDDEVTVVLGVDRVVEDDNASPDELNTTTVLELEVGRMIGSDTPPAELDAAILLDVAILLELDVG